MFYYTLCKTDCTLCNLHYSWAYWSFLYNQDISLSFFFSFLFQSVICHLVFPLFFMISYKFYKLYFLLFAVLIISHGNKHVHLFSFSSAAIFSHLTIHVFSSGICCSCTIVIFCPCHMVCGELSLHPCVYFSTYSIDIKYKLLHSGCWWSVLHLILQKCLSALVSCLKLIGLLVFVWDLL